MAHHIQLGSATLTRVIEWQVAFRNAMFPQTPSDAWDENADLLIPTFYDPETQRCRLVMQSWVIQADGLTVVVDTGVGNDRERPHLAQLDHLSTDFLGALRRAGFDPSDVDVVVNTHLHTDHVGWNTQLLDGHWAPTFPNARYLMPEADYRHFGPGGAGVNEGSRIVFADSVVPVEDQIQLWSGDYQLSESLWLRPAPGHTPGSSVVWLDAGAPAVFVGDLTHSPIQITRPSDPCAFDVDPDQAAATRRSVFTEASRRRAFVVPAHYPGHGAATLVARGDRFAVDDWLGLEPI